MMIKLFRNMRENNLRNGNTKRYIKYAFGEIFLVMIGILLAVQINNWNEDRKTENELKNILKTISADLQRDTLVAKSIIQLYDSIEGNSIKVINQQITSKNHEKYPMLRSLASVYSPYSIQTKGYEMLKRYSNKNEIQNDTLISSITQFYVPYLQIIADNNQMIKKEVLENIDDFKTKPWFVDWTKGKVSKEMITYFTESQDYRKKVAANLISQCVIINKW